MSADIAVTSAPENALFRHRARGKAGEKAGHDGSQQRSEDEHVGRYDAAAEDRIGFEASCTDHFRVL
jgi:hypothetical protein